MNVEFICANLYPPKKKDILPTEIKINMSDQSHKILIEYAFENYLVIDKDEALKLAKVILAVFEGVKP